MKKGNRIISIEGYKIDRRPSIHPKEQLRLWVRSGGRCAICNKYLLDLDYDVSIGEMAHMAGWKKDIKSPRGLEEVPMSKRNTADNLILLCAEHHKIVDTKELLQEFTLERLMKHKVEHEQRILHLTGMQVDAQSVVVRMIGGIRGVPVELSNEHARKIVYQSDNRYAKFLDSYDRQGLEIDLTELTDPEEDWDTYWKAGQGIINKNILRLHDGITGGHIRHLSVFAFSRIPLLVYLGYQLGDKIPTSFYQKHRDEQETWLWSDKQPANHFEIICLQEHSSCEIVLLLSISGSIEFQTLDKELIEGRSVYMIKPRDVVPNRDIFRNKQTYESYCKTYHSFLSDLELHHKSCKTLHIIPAIPLTAAIALGRGIMRDAQPELAIYDRFQNGYKKALNINSK